jgi:hypothetical protein
MVKNMLVEMDGWMQMVDMDRIELVEMYMDSEMEITIKIQHEYELY